MKAVLDCFAASPYYLELKFYILNNFIDDFEYQQIDRLLMIFENNLINCEI